MLRRDLLQAIAELETATNKAGQKCAVCGTRLSANAEAARAKIINIVLDHKKDLEID